MKLNAQRFEQQDDWWERLLDKGDEYRAVTRRLYQSVELVAGALVWLPGPSYIEGMKSAGIIPSRAEWKNAAIEVGKALAGFQAGLTSGFFGAIADALVGVYDLGKSVVDGIVKVFTGEALAMAEKLYDYLVELSESKNKAERIKELATSVLNALISGVAGGIDEFTERWGAANVFDKWHFRGSVVGTVVAEIAMAVVSGGAAAARLLARKLGTLGAKLLSVVDKTAEAIDGILPPKKGHRDGTPDKPKDNDLTGERGIALAKAKIITEAADKADLPIPALLAKLKPLELHKGVSGFSAPASGPGQHLVLMRTVVKDDYTPGDRTEMSPGELPGRGSERYRRLLAVIRMARSERAYASRKGAFSLRLNESLGRVNRIEADFVGQRFVGDGAVVNADGIWIGKTFQDGEKTCRRTYRPPSEKPNNWRSATGVQANYETQQRVVEIKYGSKGQRIEKDRWEIISNGHIDVE